MIRKIQLTTIALIMFFGSMFAISLFPSMASAADETAKKAVCAGAGVSSASGDGCENPDSTSVDGIIQTGLNLFSAIIGIIAIVMVMIGGVKYMTSQGESGKINEAKNSVMYALIGLVIVALAQIIVRFVLTQFT